MGMLHVAGPAEDDDLEGRVQRCLRCDLVLRTMSDIAFKGGPIPVGKRVRRKITCPGSTEGLLVAAGLDESAG